jgi:hypothetical protein
MIMRSASSLVASLLLIVITITSPSSARIRLVPEEWDNIQLAINDSDPGDTVLVGPGTYIEALEINEPSIVLASWIILEGDRGYIDSTIIDANAEGCVLRIDGGANQISLIKGFTLRNGRLDYGGGVNCRPGVRPRLEDLVIQGSTATVQGGGIYVSRDRARAFLKRVKIIGNSAPLGGGIGIFTSGIFLDSCEIRGNTATNGSALGSHAAQMISMRRTLIADNRGDVVIYDPEEYCDTLILDHVTMSGNHAANNQARPYISIPTIRQHLGISNTAFWDLQGSTLALRGTGFIEGHTSISYCDLRGGREMAQLGSDVIWGDGNFDQDPLFIAPDLGDYRLAPGSPCINTGHPDSTRDPDGNRSDVGAFTFLHQFGRIEGRVTDRATNQPLADVDVRILHDGRIIHQQICANDGGWESEIHLPDGAALFTVEARARFYHPFFMRDIELEVDNVFWANIPLSRVALEINPDSLIVAVDPGDSIRTRFSLINSDEDTIRWRSRVVSVDGLLAVKCEIEDTLNAGVILGDDRIQGVVYAEDEFFIAGAAGENPNVIYNLSREGEPLGSFLQPGTTARYGMKDLAWDGELLWGSGADTVFGFTLDGQHDNERRWQAPFTPVENIAYDPIDGLLWISGITTDLFVCDREGNIVDRFPQSRRLRKYGMAWYPEDPDGYFLYILTSAASFPIIHHYIVKVDPSTGDTATVGEFLPGADSTAQYSALDITRDYNLLRGWSYLTINNRAIRDGNDQVVIVALEPLSGWFEITPDSGEILPNEENLCELTILTLLADGTPFDSGRYDFEFRISIEGDVEGELVLPISLYIGVEPPDWTPIDAPAQPDFFEITALFPNPFNSSTTIRFSTGSQAAPTRLAAYGIDGRLVKEFNGKWKMEDGREHSVVWDAGELPGGVYLIRVQAGEKSRTVKAVLIK